MLEILRLHGDLLWGIKTYINHIPASAVDHSTLHYGPLVLVYAMVVERLKEEKAAEIVRKRPSVLALFLQIHTHAAQEVKHLPEEKMDKGPKHCHVDNILFSRTREVLRESCTYQL